MLYCIISGKYMKVGYTSDFRTLFKRVNAYRSYLPEFCVFGIRDGNKDDEKYYQTLYKTKDGCEFGFKNNKAIKSFMKKGFASNLSNYLVEVRNIDAVDNRGRITDLYMCYKDGTDIIKNSEDYNNLEFAALVEDGLSDGKIKYKRFDNSFLFNRDFREVINFCKKHLYVKNK